MVAEVMTILRSGLRAPSCRRWPRRKSMLRDRSWASSTMIVSYSERSGSPWASARSMPSVRNLIRVSRVVSSANRTLQPTSRPQGTPSSSATRRETERAATRRGWVQAIRPAVPRPAQRHILGIWVVLPDPVSPARMRTGWFRMAATISSDREEIGSEGGKSIRKGKGGGGGMGAVPAGGAGGGPAEAGMIGPFRRESKKSRGGAPGPYAGPSRRG